MGRLSFRRWLQGRWGSVELCFCRWQDGRGEQSAWRAGRGFRGRKRSGRSRRWSGRQ